MTWNNNNLRPGNPLQRPTTMTIERIIIRLVDTPPEMYHRPLAVTNFDGRQQDFIADRVVQAMHGSRSAGTLTRSSFAGCAGGFMRPTESPMSMINDYRTTYAVMWLWVRRGGGSFNQSYELVSARFPAQALQLDFSGNVVGIDPNAQFQVNNVVMLNVRHVNERGSVSEVYDFSNTCDFIADENFVSYRDSSQMFIQSPATALYGSLSNRATAGVNAAVPTSAMVTATPKPVLSANAVPAQFIATATNAYVAGTYSSDSTGLRDDALDPSEHESAMAASRLADAASKACWTPLSGNGFRFQQAMANLNAATEGSHAGLYGGIFTWADLTEIDGRLRDFNGPEADRIITVMLPGRLLNGTHIADNVRYQGYGSEWTETSAEASAIMMLINMTLTVMFELGIATVCFNGTNENREHQFRCAMQVGHELNFIAQGNTVRDTDIFCSRMENEILPEIAASGDGYYRDMTVSVMADVLGDVSVTLAFDGNTPVSKHLPATYSNQYSLLLTPNQATLTSVSNTLSSIMDGVNDQRQRVSLDLARENLVNYNAPSSSWAD